MTDGNLGDGLHVTYEPTIAEWKHGDVKERIVIPAGQITDYSSIPDKGVLGRLARSLGIDKNAPYFERNGKIHDPLYWAIKTRAGYLPPGWFQTFNPLTGEWIPVLYYRWTRQQADAIWRRVGIEDGCPEKVANRCYRFLRLFGGLHMALT